MAWRISGRTAGDEQEQTASWPSGKEIAFCSNRSGNFEIWAMKQNGTQEHQVMHMGGRMIFPDFSPDGTKIAFSGHLPGGTNEDIFVANADGSRIQQLTSDPGMDAYPAWSPDGSKIAFISDRSGIEQVWVIDANGANPTQLTTAFVRDFGNSDRPVMLMNADGSDQHPLTGHGALQFVPGWQARGERIDHTP